MQTGTKVEFIENVCCQISKKICRAALSKHEKSGIKEILTIEKSIDLSVESCGPGEPHVIEKDFVLSPESEELSDEESDDDYLFENISDTDFLEVEETDVIHARSETSFDASLNSVACAFVTALASNFGGCFSLETIRWVLGAYGV